MRGWLGCRRRRRQDRECAARAAEYRREVEARPYVEHRSGYEFVQCLSCGWSLGVRPPVAAETLAGHVSECPCSDRALHVPMWSIAWPYYWDEREVAYRERLGNGAPYGLEMSWRVRGSHSERHGLMTGGSAKEWFLFPTGPA